MPEISRRNFLGNTAAYGAAALLAGQSNRVAASETFELPFANGTREMVAAGTFPGKAEMILQRTRPPLLETPWSVLGQNVFTPNESFFVRWHFADFPTHIDVDSFRIKVFGHVEKPFELSLSELMSGFEPTDIAAVNQCTGNSRGRVTPRVAGAQWLDGAMGNALWTGVPLAQIISRSKPLAGASHVAFRSLERLVSMFPKGDIFEKVLPIEKATDGEVLVAYGMNGAQLPVLNGSPLRLIVPGWYSTYWVKMLSEIEVMPHPGEHLWMAGAYKVPDLPNGSMKPGQTGLNFVPVSGMNPRSFFSNVEDGTRLQSGKAFELRGLAFGGDCALTTVDISQDEGTTWISTTLGKDWGPYSFREWSLALTPTKPGKLTLLARATNRKGSQQPMVAGWNPGGFMYNGVLRANVEIL